jgi:Flp pilus assembly pilin Flp
MQSIAIHTRVLAALMLARIRAVGAWTARGAPQLGQSMVEYAIIAALVAVVALGAIRLLGGSLGSTFSHIDSAVNTANSAGP